MAEQSSTRSDRAELLVWTDVDPVFEQDFNRWYDREHMVERVGIPGFHWARRYRAANGPRPYLALYRTDSLGTFKSAAYQHAFANQTAWSRTNLGRMRDAVRRVATVPLSVGTGTGGAVALVRLPPGEGVVDRVSGALGRALESDGALGARLLIPDGELSTPLPAASKTELVLMPLLVIEATDEAAAAAAGRRVEDTLAPGREDGVATFTLMWELRADQLV